MNSIIQNYHLRNIPVEINLSQVPTISDTTREFLSDWRVKLPVSPTPPSPELGSLLTTARLLNSAENNRSDAQIRAVIITGLQVMGIAFAILGWCIAPPLVGAICTITGLGYLFIIAVLSETLTFLEQIENVEPRHQKSSLLSILDRVFPAVDLLTRVPRLQRALAHYSQNPQTQQDLARFRQEYEQLLPHTHNFYRQDQKGLVPLLDQNIKELTQSVQSTPTNRRGAVADRLARAQKAKAEVKAMIDFYGKMG